MEKTDNSFIHWFRNDLRLHDLPAIDAALKKYSLLYPVYIFNRDELERKEAGYNRIRFILEALQDIDRRLRQHQGRLFVYTGKPVEVLVSLINQWGVACVSYEEDNQPGWREMEVALGMACEARGVEVVKRVSHTLWDPNEVLAANNGQPPVTFDVFSLVVETLGKPLKPGPPLNLASLTLANDSRLEFGVPSSPEEIGCPMECPQQKNKIWLGGETRALEHLQERLQVEKKALEEGLVMPNQVQPDLLGPPMSMSAALARGCLSTRRFYWSLMDVYDSVNPDFFLPDSLIGQLMWREYYYAMCTDNPFYATMAENPICLNIPWGTNEKHLACWTKGQTGFPFIDAAMRQIHQEGWAHHVARNALACFLTRGDLWISWVEGYKAFMQLLLDADVPVCAGNWMWVSSSAFEIILESPNFISPVTYGKHFEPTGEYIRKFVPELQKMPTPYIYSPWTAPLEVQQEAGCLVGVDYPLPIVQHEEISKVNADRMESLRRRFLGLDPPLHCAPSNANEAATFMRMEGDSVHVT